MTFTTETSLVDQLLRDAEVAAGLLSQQRGVVLARATIQVTVSDRELLGALGSIPGARRRIRVDGSESELLAVDHVMIARRGGELTVRSLARAATPEERARWLALGKRQTWFEVE